MYIDNLFSNLPKIHEHGEAIERQRTFSETSTDADERKRSDVTKDTKALRSVSSEHVCRNESDRDGTSTEPNRA